jgi:regulatory protein
LRKIAAGLAAKGVDAEDRAAALASLRETTDNPDLAAACAFARRRRLGPFRRGSVGSYGAADRQRELAIFARAGFARREAEAVLSCSDPDAVAALLEGEWR